MIETTKISLKGQAGQGVKLLGYVLAHILADKGYNLALTSEYDAFARAGKSSSFLIFSKEKIENPIVERADLEYDLEDNKLREELQKKSNGPLNMILLGVTLNKLDINVSEETLKKYLPKDRLTENLAAIQKGLSARLRRQTQAGLQ